MINSWRKAWSGTEEEKAARLFGVATLAAGGSEGAGVHMAGMRWSQTANYGHWPNPAMPNVFGAQVYDLGDPWANVSGAFARCPSHTRPPSHHLLHTLTHVHLHSRIHAQTGAPLLTVPCTHALCVLFFAAGQ